MNTVSKFLFAIMLTIGYVNLNAGETRITFKTSGVTLQTNSLTIKQADITEGKTWATLLKEQFGSLNFTVIIENKEFNLDQSITQEHVKMIQSLSTIHIIATENQKTTRKKSKFVDMYYDATTEAQAQAQTIGGGASAAAREKNPTSATAANAAILTETSRLREAAILEVKANLENRTQTPTMDAQTTYANRFRQTESQTAALQEVQTEAQNQLNAEAGLKRTEASALQAKKIYTATVKTGKYVLAFVATIAAMKYAHKYGVAGKAWAGLQSLAAYVHKMTQVKVLVNVPAART